MNYQKPYLLVPSHLVSSYNWRDALLSNILTYVYVEIPFPGSHATISELRRTLKALPLDVALRLTCIANRTVSAPTGESKHLRQLRLLNLLANQEDIARINWFKRVGLKEGAPLVPFFRGQLLELLRWVLLYCAPKGSSNPAGENEDLKDRRAFFKAALIASEIWGKRVHERSIVADDKFFGDQALAYSRLSVDANSMAPDLWRSLGRTIALFRDYLSEHWPGFDSEFQDRTAIALNDYQACAAVLIASYLVKEADTGLIALPTFAEHLVDAEVMNRFMSLVSATPAQLREEIWPVSALNVAAEDDIPEYFTKPLRERPVLKISEQVGAILDPVFFSDLLLVGPLFQVVKGMDKNDSKDRFGRFGKAFEAYVLDMLKNSLEADRDSGVEVIMRNVPVNDLEIDALSKKRQVLFIFEVKSLFIPEVEVVPRDPQVYIESLRKHYVIDKESDRPLKAVGQLARISHVLGKYDDIVEGCDRPATMLVIPVMIVHDRLLSAPLHGRFLANEFKQRLAPEETLESGQMRLSRGLRVAPLVVLTVEDVENFESSAEYLSITGVIAEYSHEVPGRELSVHDFVAGSEYRSRMQTNKSLAERGRDLLKEAGRRLFGRNVDQERETADS